MIECNKTGIVKLQDDLTMDFGLYTGSEYICLNKLFTELADREISMKIADVKYDLILLQGRGVIKRQKSGKEYIFKMGDINLSDILWDLTGTKINMQIKSIEITKNNESEDKEENDK